MITTREVISMLAWILFIGLFSAPAWIWGIWLIFLKKMNDRYPTPKGEDSTSIAATDD